MIMLTELRMKNKDLDRKIKQLTDIKIEMSKILDDERQVYKDSKKLYEEEINGLKINISAKVDLINLACYRKMKTIL